MIWNNWNFYFFKKKLIFFKCVFIVSCDFKKFKEINDLKKGSNYWSYCKLNQLIPLSWCKGGENLVPKSIN